MKKSKMSISFWIFVLPALLSLLLVVIIPFFIGIYYSFTDWNGIATNVSSVGFENYKSAFTADPNFIHAIIVTVVYTIINLVVLNIVAFGLAILVTRNLKFTSIYRAGFFIPNLIGGLILGYLWKFMFNNVVPSVAELMGAAEGSDFLMLSNSNTALFAICIAWTWQYAGYIMMIYVTAIQNVPNDLIEAAQIDGASAWQRMRHITLPMVAPAFTVTMFLVLINSFKQFDVNYSLTNGGPSTMFMGNVVDGTALVSMDIYNEAFIGLNFASAQAKAVLFFIALCVISIIQVIYNKRKEIEV